MRVLLITQYYLPEPEKIRSALAESLQARGHEVTVLTGYPCYPAGKLFSGYRISPWMRETINGISVVRVPLYPDHSRSALRRAWNYISFAISASLLGHWLVPRFDVVHVVLGPYSVALPGLLLSLLRRKPLTISILDMWPETLAATGMVNNRLAIRMVGWFADFCYRRTKAIHVVTPGFRENLIGKSVPAEKLHVIPNWVDTDVYRPHELNPELAKSLGLADSFNIMYAGTIGLAQGIDTILDAAGQLGDLPKIQFVLVGDGSDLDRARARAETEGLANVRFLGRFPNESMPDLYALANVLLVHLRDEPLFRITIPHKIYAYMASAKPILAALEGDGAETIRSANAGLVCAPGNPQALANAVREFYHLSFEKREAMGNNGRRVVCEYYNQEYLIGQIAEMLANVVEQHR